MDLKTEKKLTEEEKYIEECLEKIKPEVEQKLRELGLVDDKGNPKELGVCYKEWAIIKRLMKEKFDIDWKSPADSHPEVNFD